jgi:hypothetical protein
MKIRIILLVAVVVLMSTAATSADAAMSAWEWIAGVVFVEGAPGLRKVTLSAEVLERARDNLADLRLQDANHTEIPFAVRVRREVNDVKRIQTREFNRVTAPGGVSELAVELDGSAESHNEIEIETSGQNFRRQVELEGSDDGREWRVVRTDGVIFSFESNNKRIESNRIAYPESRYRFLRAKIARDAVVDQNAPEITSLAVMMTVRDAEVAKGWGVTVPMVSAVRADGSPGTAWLIDLGHRVPCNRLSLDIKGESFSRPYSIELADDPQNLILVTSGEIKRRAGEAPKNIDIVFEEVRARRLRLITTDFANPSLNIVAITASGPARELWFEMKEGISAPLWLFVGNPNAGEPRYDFESEVSSNQSFQVSAVTVLPIEPNPNFRPPPKPLTERVPWLIYAVLTIASVALGLILLSLIRTAQRSRLPSLDGPQSAE